MNIWIDAQLPPTLASWLTNNFALEATALRDIELRDAQDTEIFYERPRQGNARVLKQHELQML